MNIEGIKEVLDRHEKIALQLSGGKDSLACLYLCKPFIDQITVYWGNTGDAYPEQIQTINAIKEWVPHFVEVTGRQPEVIRECGYPSDVVPVSHTAFGNMLDGGNLQLIQDRYSCCFRSLMLPMHERMIADGITLIIRGQKNADALKPPLRSGDQLAGFEFLYPIEDWSVRQIFDFLNESKAPIPRFYEMLDEAADCMTCTAWWEKGELKYKKRYHHDAYAETVRRHRVISDAVGKHIAFFNKENMA